MPYTKKAAGNIFYEQKIGKYRAQYYEKLVEVVWACKGNNRLHTYSVMILVSTLLQHKASQDQAKTSAQGTSRERYN